MFLLLDGMSCVCEFLLVMSKKILSIYIYQSKNVFVIIIYKYFWCSSYIAYDDSVCCLSLMGIMVSCSYKGIKFLSLLHNQNGCDSTMDCFMRLSIESFSFSNSIRISAKYCHWDISWTKPRQLSTWPHIQEMDLQTESSQKSQHVRILVSTWT